MVHFGKFCGQIVFPDMSVLIGQKLIEKAKIQKFKCDILGDFQTLEQAGGVLRRQRNVTNAKSERTYLP